MRIIRSKSATEPDITAIEVFFWPAIIMLSIAFLLALVTTIYVIATVIDNDIAYEHNLAAAKFNALPFEEREARADSIDAWAIDPNTYLIVEREIRPLSPLSAIPGVTAHTAALACASALAVIASLSIFISYWLNKYDDYCLFSLPYHRPYGWLLFFCMFVGWPFMLGSFVMWLIGRTDWPSINRARSLR